MFEGAGLVDPGWRPTRPLLSPRAERRPRQRPVEAGQHGGLLSCMERPTRSGPSMDPATSPVRSWTTGRRPNRPCGHRITRGSS
jgi:hypothetical protein